MEAETPTSNQPPRVNRGRRLLGPAALRTYPFGFAAKPSPSAPWARGLLSAFWEWGYRDLPACGLRRGSRSGPVRTIFINTCSRPSRGAKPRGRTTGGFLRRGLVKLAREEAERSRWGTSRGAHDASHDDQGRQAGAGPRNVLLSSLVQREQAQARASSKGTCFGATRPRPAQRQEVIVEPKPASPPEPLAGEDQL